MQKALANAGVASRRAVEEMIAAGRVSVNGLTVSEMGVRVQPGDVIDVDGQRVSIAPSQAREAVYLALHKPDGVVSTSKDTHGRPTVLDLVKNAIKPGSSGVRLYPVGRLDSDSTGLILLTNDGDLTHRLTHPRFGVEKEYRATVRGRPSEASLQKLRDGVEVEGEMTAPAKVEYLSAIEGNAILRVVIKEGRKRQVRLMLSAVGHPVMELSRMRFGPIQLGTLASGEWRNLALHEVHALRKAAGLPASGAREATKDEGRKPKGPGNAGRSSGVRGRARNAKRSEP